MSTEEQHEEVVEVIDEEFIGNCSADVDTTCTICQAEFLDPDDLTVHLHQIHKITTAGSKLCYFCSHKYSDLIEFAEHIRDEHLTSLFFCLHCLRAFVDENEHRLHEKKHKRSFKAAHCCSQCSETFGNTCDLRIHDFEKHYNNDEGIMIQPILPYLSAVLNVKAETVLVSLRTDTIFICVCCNYSTSSIKHFIEHSKTSKCSPIVCDLCSNTYKKKHSFYMHLMKYCGKNYNNMRIECPDCKLVFNKFTLKEHKKFCKAIKCYTCNTYYDSMYELSEHQTKEHPLSVELKTCNFCWKQCVGSVALQKHMDRSHMSELHLYKYLCVYCKTPYKHPQKLFGHFFSKHKDLEPYTCKICSKTFRLRKRFTLHIKLEHQSVGFVEFDENYNVFFTDKKSENPFIPKSLYKDEQERTRPGKDDDSNISLQKLNSEMSVTETEGNQTDAEKAPKPTLKRKRDQRAPKKEQMETITLESSDDESLLVVKKRVLKQQKTVQSKLKSKSTKKQIVNNKKRFTCHICNKYCYTYQNFNHHVSLHSKKDFKKCIKCSRYFRSKDKLNQHMQMHHSSSKLTDTLKHMLEKRKKGESITSDLPMSEKFRRTIKKVEFEESNITAKITEVDNSISVQKFIENFTPEAENRPDIVINHSVTMKIVKGVQTQRHPVIKMTKFKPKPMPLTTKLAMPVKFKSGQCERVTATIKLIQPVPVEDNSQDSDSQNDDNDNDNYNYVDRNDSIPEVAEEVMLEGTDTGTEETPKAIQIPHKIVIPKVLSEYKDLRIAHLLPQAPYYKIVKVNDVINQQQNKPTAQNEANKRNVDIKLPDGTKLVNTNPLAHLLGKTPIEKVLEPKKKKYYKPKVRDFQGMLAEALSNLERPTKRRRETKDANTSETGSHVET